MKRVGVLLTLLLLFSLIGFVLAGNETNDTDSGNDVYVPDEEGVDAGFACLEKVVGDGCSGADSVEELALTVLASPDIADKCVDKLKRKEKLGECFGDNRCDIKDTALAILALNHAGEDTEKYEEWLLSKNRTSEDLIWYLEQDANEKTECKFSYDGKDYNVLVNDNKKLSTAAGSCLSLAPSSFWLQIKPDCYDTEFMVSCDKDFVATLLYQQRNSPTLYVLSDTESAPAFDTITINPRSFCFGENSCDYEATAWATLALLKTNHDIEDFIPYIVAMEDTNKQYLSKAFSYVVTESDEYAQQLIEQKGALDDYWVAELSAYDKFYDTALAILSIGGVSSEVDNKARGWFEFTQEEDGCWKGKSDTKIRNTAMILWALEGRRFSGSSGGGGGGVTRCTTAGFYCMTESECDSENILDNYFCEGLTQDTCCRESNLEYCSALEGEVCDSGYVCEGGSRDSLDGSCCLGDCIEAQYESECEQEGYFCKNSCSANQEEVDFLSCDGEGACCKRSEDDGGSNTWIWVVLIIVLIGVGVGGWIYREKLKLWFFKVKSKFGKGKGGKSSSGSGPGSRGGMPPKPGFPPVRRRPPMPMSRPSVRPPKRDAQLDEVFKKLDKMSK